MKLTNEDIKELYSLDNKEINSLLDVIIDNMLTSNMQEELYDLLTDNLMEWFNKNDEPTNLALIAEKWIDKLTE